MNRVARFLVIEDDPEWRENLREILSPAGYDIEDVATRQDAKQRLVKGLFHLLIVDLELEGGSSPTNEEGMVLLRELDPYGLNEALRVIVLTAHGTDDRMREAFGRHGVGDFFRKQSFDEVAFLTEVKRLLESLKINFALTIHWQSPLDAESAVLNLRIQDARIKRGSSEQQQLAGELDDLLCRLFHRAESLLVGPLGGGKSGAGVLLAQPFYADGGGRPVVVKFGDYRDVQQENERFEQFVLPYVGGGRNTAVLNRRRTPNLGGIVYSLVGDVGARLGDFAEFYRSSSSGEIQQALDQLFFATCGVWYESPGTKRPLDLTRYYFDWLGMTPEGLARSLEALKSVQGGERLHFRSLSAPQKFPNPLSAFPAKPIVLPTYETITHGDLHPHNILLDEHGHSWLIDFQRTGRGHVLRDAVELDSAIRLNLLGEEEATLDERLLLEEALVRPKSFTEFTEAAVSPPGANPAIAKAFAACSHLRDIAGRLVARHTSADVSEYYAGTLFCALNSIRFLALPTLQREHALLSACVLTKRLGF